MGKVSAAKTICIIMMPERYSSYKDPSAADLILRCMLITEQLINRDLLETLRTYHAHEIERDPQMFLKEFPHLYYVLTEDDQKEFPSVQGLQLPQKLLSTEELKKLFDCKEDFQTLLYSRNLPEYFSNDLLNSIFTAYKFLFPDSI